MLQLKKIEKNFKVESLMQDDNGKYDIVIAFKSNPKLPELQQDLDKNTTERNLIASELEEKKQALETKVFKNKKEKESVAKLEKKLLNQKKELSLLEKKLSDQKKEVHELQKNISEKKEFLKENSISLNLEINEVESLKEQMAHKQKAVQYAQGALKSKIVKDEALLQERRCDVKKLWSSRKNITTYTNEVCAKLQLPLIPPLELKNFVFKDLHDIAKKQKNTYIAKKQQLSEIALFFSTNCENLEAMQHDPALPPTLDYFGNAVSNLPAADGSDFGQQAENLETFAAVSDLPVADGADLPAANGADFRQQAENLKTFAAI